MLNCQHANAVATTNSATARGAQGAELPGPTQPRSMDAAEGAAEPEGANPEHWPWWLLLLACEAAARPPKQLSKAAQQATQRPACERVPGGLLRGVPGALRMRSECIRKP